MLRKKTCKVNWWKLVWGRHVVPRHGFIVWMAILIRLAIKIKLVKWKSVSDDKCNFCHVHEETMKHLFFAISNRVWKEVLQRYEIKRGL